jgi:hypothetical protein
MQDLPRSSGEVGDTLLVGRAHCMGYGADPFFVRDRHGTRTLRRCGKLDDEPKAWSVLIWRARRTEPAHRPAGPGLPGFAAGADRPRSAAISHCANRLGARECRNRTGWTLPRDGRRRISDSGADLVQRPSTRGRADRHRCRTRRRRSDGLLEAVSLGRAATRADRRVKSVAQPGLWEPGARIELASS